MIFHWFFHVFLQDWAYFLMPKWVYKKGSIFLEPPKLGVLFFEWSKLGGSIFGKNRTPKKSRGSIFGKNRTPNFFRGSIFGKNRTPIFFRGSIFRGVKK